MRLRRFRPLLGLLLSIAFVALAGSASADHHEEASDEVEIIEYTGGTLEGEEEAVADPSATREQMRTMADVRFGPDTHFFSRVPFTINRMGDLFFLRPVNLSLGLVGALTYGFAFGPTLISDADKHDELVDGLLVEPWRMLWNRPLGGPLDYRAASSEQPAAEIPAQQDLPIE